MTFNALHKWHHFLRNMNELKKIFLLKDLKLVFKRRIIFSDQNKVENG